MITAGLAFRSTPIRSSLGRLGVRLGDASYSIYLVSLIVFYIYDRIYPLVARLGPDVNIILSFLLVTVVGLLCYRYVERPMTLFINAKYHGLRTARRFAAIV
jgi:peptidoglycan/LPS O-acetylase OafA/YrhL